MKHYLLTALSVILISSPIFAQSMQDARELQQLMKQYQSQVGELKGKEQLNKEELSSTPSLEKFQDSLTTKMNVVKDTSQVQEKKSGLNIEQNAFSGLKYFGFEFFQNINQTYNPEIYGPVDDLYPVGPGDEVVINVWGEVQLRHDLTVNREGQVYIPDVGVVTVAGLNMGQLKQKLIRVMGKSYSSLLNKKAHLEVSMGKLRSVRVFVVGEVNNPGVYTVPALTPVVNMLGFAGGPRDNGSLRNIYVVRNDSIAGKLDFYQFLTKGEKFTDIRLQNEDVILIPPAKRKVYLAGAVNHPAIFELKENESIPALIDFAGGFREDAYTRHIEVERFIDNRDKKFFDISFEQIKTGQMPMALENGDRVEVPVISREIKNYVTISGPIYGPTRFEYSKDMTISQLVAKLDSIRGEAYLERVQVTRTLADEKKEIFSVNLKAILDHSQADFALAPMDEIAIQSTRDLFPTDSVRIFGAVNVPGKYEMKKNMTLKDLVFAAGGFREDAVISEAEVSRIDPRKMSPNALAQILYIKIDSNYTKIDQAPDEVFQLQPYDNIFIRENSDWELQRNVAVKGEVKYPGVYSLRNKNEKVTDMIERAGGLKPTAYLEGATFLRTQNGVGQIGVDFRKILKNNRSDENIILQDGDVINIPEQLHSVKVIGGVNFPSSVLYEKGKGLEHYINGAGGYTELADKKNVSIRLANGRVIRQKRFLFWKYLPKDISAGSTVIVPSFKEAKRTDWSGALRDAAAILSSAATTILIINQVSK